jgi:serine protease inhibitor
MHVRFKVMMIVILGIMLAPVLCESAKRITYVRVVAGNPQDYKALAGNSINRFALDLYAKLPRGKNNLVFSPLSGYSPLAMAYAGASGKTKEEMTAVLGVKKADVPFHKTLGGLTHDLNNIVAKDGGQLLVANGIWAHDHPVYKIREEFRKTLKDNYDVDIKVADFIKAPDDMVTEMNEWVEKKTAGRITDIVTLEDVRPDKKAQTDPGFILLNAVYFKCLWEEQFKTERTKKETFYLLDGSRFKTPMMHHFSKYYKYMEEPAFQALEMSYKGSNVSMVVFLPKKKDGLEEFEKSLTSEKLANWLGKITRHRDGVVVTFPKFTMESELKLVSPLKAIGMETAFNSEAKPSDLFSGMVVKKEPDSRERTLFVKEVFQEAWIEVNEKGTEAAAATKMTVQYDTGAPPPPKIFRADHPFMFLIIDKMSNCILFMGRVTKPEQG